jgi:glutathione S-transferase
MALFHSGIKVEVREVVLKDKPEEMLQASPKGTVPVLIIPDATVIDESLDIMYWALNQSDPSNLLCRENHDFVSEISTLIDENDSAFKQHLDLYKYHDRHPENPQSHYRSLGEQFLQKLEERLKLSKFLINESPSLADLAIFPFIRQFAHVDKEWFYNSEYTELIHWLDFFLEGIEFKEVMTKFSQWCPDTTTVFFPKS